MRQSQISTYPDALSPDYHLLSEMRPLSYIQALAPLLIVGLFSQICRGSNFDANSQFAWIDHESCDGLIDRVNAAGDDYNNLINAAIDSLAGLQPKTDLLKGTLESYFHEEYTNKIKSTWEHNRSTGLTRALR